MKRPFLVAIGALAVSLPTAARSEAPAVDKAAGTSDSEANTRAVRAEPMQATDEALARLKQENASQRARLEELEQRLTELEVAAMSGDIAAEEADADLALGRGLWQHCPSSKPTT